MSYSCPWCGMLHPSITSRCEERERWLDVEDSERDEDER